MPINDRTPNLNLALPHVDNYFPDDVGRLRSALTDLDSAVAGKASTGSLATKADLVDGKVPSSQLPSYVDDVLEYATLAALPLTGEGSKIYIVLDTGKTYRWSGAAYVEISASPGSTDAVPEGATNKYFTDARARAAQALATVSEFGLVKIGSGLGIDGDGKLVVIGASGGATQAFDEVRLTPASNGQTVFTIVGGYVAGQVELFLNGVLLYGDGDDYTASNGGSIILAVGANTTDTLLLRRWSQFDVVNLPKVGVFQRTVATAATLLDTDRGNIINASGTFTLSVTAAATLGDGWYCYVRNTSNGNVTIDPASSEQIDGAATFVLRPGCTVLLTCTGTAFGVIGLKWRTYDNIASFTANGTFVVPADTYVIRGYAFGKGGDGTTTNSGGGGGCAYGDITVTPGESVTVSISSGVATVTTGGTSRLKANAASGTTAGTASKHASVTNGGNYSGGAGGAGGGGGASGSPLGVGGGIGGTGGSAWGGFASFTHGGAGVGEGGGVGDSGGGSLRTLANRFTDPLLSPLTGSGGIGSTTSYAGPGGPGGGGGGTSASGQGAGIGGVGAGGGGAFNAGGATSLFGGGGGYGDAGGAGGLGGGGGGAGGATPGTGGAACVLIYY